MAVARSLRPEQTAHCSAHWMIFQSVRVCSIVSGNVRFTRLLRFIFLLGRRGVIGCTVGDREDSTTNYNVQVERFDSHRALSR
jgi:hypothetical protein